MSVTQFIYYAHIIRGVAKNSGPTERISSNVTLQVQYKLWIL